MVLSGLCYLLLALAGVLGLGFGALLPAVQGYWPMGPWVGPAAAGLHFLGAAAGVAVAGRWGRARPETWATGGGLLLGTGALLSLGVSGSGELLLLRLAGGVGAGAVGVAALDRLLGTVPREAGAAAVGGAAAAGTAGTALAFWGGPRLIPETGWQGALALPGGLLLLASLVVPVLARSLRPGASRVAAAGPLPLRHLFPLTAAALLANGAFGAGLLLLPLLLEGQQGFPPHLAGSLAAAAALATVLAGPVAGLLGEIVARRRVLYGGSAMLVGSVALAFALRQGGPGWVAGFLAVALGGAGAGLAALFPMAAVTVGPEGALVTLCVRE
ncbi:MAG: MFS transporter [candidate division NC10 bacterium]|nr:MFS transporter [candidate division NC10 bacterium]